jgi:hypothetical protein
LLILYIFTSLKVFPIEVMQKHYIDSPIEAMSPSGNGFKNTNQRNFQPREARSMDILSMKLKLKLAINTYGYGLQLSLRISKYFRLIYHLKEQYSTSRIEPKNALMTIFYAKEKRNVNYIM